MLMRTFRRGVAVASTVALAAGISGAAQAATFSYTSTLTFSSTTNPSPVAVQTAIFTKTDLPEGTVGYKLRSFRLSLINNQTYTLANLPQYQGTALLLNSFLPGQYQSILPNIISNARYDYIGDGNFPPPDFSYNFTAEEVANATARVRPTVAQSLPNELATFDAVVGLFPEGGNLRLRSVARLVTSSPISDVQASSIDLPTTSAPVTNEAVPEPTTIAGLALASSGLVAARRRRQAS